MSGRRLVRVQDRGQVTLPADLRNKLGLKKGDLVDFVETEDGVLISPREVGAMQAMEKLGEILTENGVTLEDWIASGGDIRGELIKEKYGLTSDE